MQALAGGDVQWASDPALSSLFHDAAVMVALDGQRYSGLAAIIRRLNGGALSACGCSLWHGCWAVGLHVARGWGVPA